jgi:protein TonB
MPQAELSNEARQEIHDEVKEKIIVNFEAKSVLGLIVDVNGNPQGVCIWKAAGLGLDLQAAKAVRRYKFKPATKDGKPVPMRLAVAVTFRAH